MKGKTVFNILYCTFILIFLVVFIWSALSERQYRIDQYDHAVELYEEGKWKEAMDAFSEIYELREDLVDGPSAAEYYLKSLEKYNETIPVCPTCGQKIWSTEEEPK